MNQFKSALRWLLTQLYQVEVQGLGHFNTVGTHVLIVANHTSFLDAVLLYDFLSNKLKSAVNTYIARAWYM